MAQKGILESKAKQLLAKVWPTYFGDDLYYQQPCTMIEKEGDLNDKWLKNNPLVIKPDMLFGERGKNNLVFYKKETAGDVQLDDVKTWLKDHLNKELTLLNGAKGQLKRFIVEPFIPHSKQEEYFISIRTDQQNDIICLSNQGGIDIMENWDAVTEIQVPVMLGETDIEHLIQNAIPKDFAQRNACLKFTCGFYKLFKALHFAYLEVNPFLIRDNQVFLLDMVAKVDDTAHFLMGDDWGALCFPSEFGKPSLSEEEKAISKMDEQSGASLKLSILNPKGLVWTLVAGGGASVVFADTIADSWGVEELANYGEYSGNPSTEETYDYAKIVLDLMTREKDPNGRRKVLLIGGAIANFTDVAKTFNGIIKAFEKYADKMNDIGVNIYVRRGGPNYEIGLKNIRTAAKKLGLSIEVYGPETHVTDIVKISYDDCAVVSH